MANLLEDIEDIAGVLLNAVTDGDTKVNSTGKELVITLGGHIGNLGEAPQTKIYPLYTQVELGIAQGFIAMVDRIDSKPGDGEVEIDGDFKTPKESLLFIKITLKADVQFTMLIRDVQAAPAAAIPPSLAS